MKFVCAKKFVLKVGFFVFAIGGGAMYAGDFSMQGLAEHLSLKNDVKSMQFFEKLNDAKIEFVETKAFFSNDWYAESSITYNVNTSEAFVLENTEVMEANAAAMPKKYNERKIYSKAGVFRKNSENDRYTSDEYSRLFTENRTYPNVQRYLCPSVENISAILDELAKDHRTRLNPAVVAELKEAVKANIKQLLSNKKIDVLCAGKFSIKASLAKNDMLEYLQIDIPNLNFKFKVENSFNKKRISVADYKFFDPVTYKLKTEKTKGDYGIEILFNRIELNKEWAKYLYKDMAKKGVLTAEILKINGVDFKTLTLQKIADIVENSGSLSIVFNKDGKNIEYKFVRFNPIQIAAIENAKIMGVDSEIFFN